MWLMGDPFLRAYYSIYDMDNKQIGMVGIADTTRTTSQTKTTMEFAKNTKDQIRDSLGFGEHNEMIFNLLIAAISCVFMGVCCCCV